jgi:hypothetical protein
VRVPPGQSLTISPGVEVLFSVYCKLIVDTNATLHAVGTAADFIRFDVLPPNEHWHGIRFLIASDSSRLECCYLTNGLASSYSWPDYCGGAIYCYNSNPTIINNNIANNSASKGGGIYCESNSNPAIGGNIICENSAEVCGGGIYCDDYSNPSICGNVISENSVINSQFSQGGGIYIGVFSTPIINNNIISHNYVTWRGGGILCSNFVYFSDIINNTIISNHAADGGGLYSVESFPELTNCIFWNNAHQQISYTQISLVTYCNIQGGWPGTGNISVNPMFVNPHQNDYRLQWSSPCIDSGDPDPIYNDPDGTRADMGAWYYDQSMPVCILLTPYNVPIQIPASGGSFEYAIQATNIAADSLSVLVWCDATLPDGSTYGPVLGPVNINLTSSQTLSRLRTQAVPAEAPAGMYNYNAYAVAGGDTSTDSFTFVKLGTDGWNLGISGWMNTGEEFINDAISRNDESCYSSFIIYHSVNPNPFNSSTAISFELRDASWVELKVFDITGREVASLVTGQQSAGQHQVVWDPEGMPSGVYFVRLKAGEYNQTRKILLIK